MKSVNRIIKRMGDKWVCHPKNHVKRLDQPLTDSAGTNIAATFERIKAERAQQPTNVRKIVVAR